MLTMWWKKLSWLPKKFPNIQFKKSQALVLNMCLYIRNDLKFPIKINTGKKSINYMVAQSITGN